MKIHEREIKKKIVTAATILQNIPMSIFYTDTLFNQHVTNV